MANIELSDEQKEQIRIKADETLRQVVEIEECADSCREKFHQEAESYIKMINRDSENYQKVSERRTLEHQGILNELQEGIASGDVNATIALLEKLKK
jgi:hypothetical protein